MSVEDNRTYLQKTRKVAIYLWSGLSLALTLFFVQSQIVFVTTDPLPSQKAEWGLVGLGILTFLFGFFFFKNYTSLRRDQLLRMPLEQRKQSLLVAFVLQFILFESLGLYGVLLSVLTQSSEKALPFIVFAYLGFFFAFPRQAKLEPFFKG
jgi:FtsH-binding integral membrane protein